MVLGTSPSKVKGVTLIELMITLVIVGIVFAIAYPSYQSSLIDSRRTDAQNALLGFATAMERFRTDNATYDDAHSGTGYPNPPLATVFPAQTPIDSSDKFYNLTIQSADNNGFTLRATPIGGSAQDGDGYLELTSIGHKRWDKNNNGSTLDSGENNWTD